LPPIKLADVIVDGHCWPVLSQHGLTEWLSFAEGNGPESCPLCGKGKPADAAEQIKVRSFIHPSARLSVWLSCGLMGWQTSG
jgi:hypothetical protein